MNRKHENLIKKLQTDETFRAEYEARFDDHIISTIPRILGHLMVFFGNSLYGTFPTYGKFKAVEIIARIPYQSWEVASYMFLTAMFSDENKAIELAKLSEFGRVAQDNETMHVVVISQLAHAKGQNGIFKYFLIPLIFSFFYFLASLLLYLVNRKWSFELNYMFECHAYEQYSLFIKDCGADLKRRKVNSRFLDFYGRKAENQYELFTSIRDDELIHRNESLELLTR